MQNDLLPCPFGCDEKYKPTVIIDRECNNEFFIECSNCDTTIPKGKETEEEAIEEWNTRNNSKHIIYKNGFLDGIKEVKRFLDKTAREIIDRK